MTYVVEHLFDSFRGQTTIRTAGGRATARFSHSGPMSILYPGQLDIANLQTQHEWCRLQHLSRDLDPSFVASGRLHGTWVGTDNAASTPHVPGTPGMRGAARRHLVEISATPRTNALPSVPFVVFRSDFTSSAPATVAKQTLRICGNTNENIVATLIPARTKGATLIVPVPGTARSWTVRDHRGGFEVTFAIKVTPNSCQTKSSRLIRERGGRA